MTQDSISMYDFVKDSYTNFGEYVNLHRHIPNVFDGLKPIYRKCIFACMDIASNNMTKVYKISAQAGSNYSPHGTASIDPVVSKLVHAGIFDGQGNHGKSTLIGGDLPPAAPRYIEAMMNPKYLQLFSTLLPYIKRIENDCNNTEPEYLPTPIPLSLTFGSLGIGIATGVKIPAFTPKSIMEAYLKDDPELLESSDGLEILDKKALHDLWITGKSFLKYKIKTYEEDGSIVMEGNKGPIRVNLDRLLEWKNDGRVKILNETRSIPKLRFTKAPRVQSPTYEEILQEVENISKGNLVTYLRVVYKDQVRPLGMRDWIDITYKNYIKLLNTHRNTSICNLKSDIVFYSNFRKIADLIINNDDLSYDDIASKVGVDINIVSRVSQKTINTLRTLDPSNKCKDAEEKIKEFENMNFDSYIQNIVLSM